MYLLIHFLWMGEKLQIELSALLSATLTWKYAVDKVLVVLASNIRARYMPEKVYFHFSQMTNGVLLFRDYQSSYFLWLMAWQYHCPVSGCLYISSHQHSFECCWTAACQASLPITSSQSLLKLMSIESGMPSNHLIFCCPLFLLSQSFPASESFQMSQLFSSGGQSIGASASASVHTMNIKDWFPLGLTGWISLQSEGPSRFFSNTTIQKHLFFNAHLSLWSNSQICI